MKTITERSQQHAESIQVAAHDAAGAVAGFVDSEKLAETIAIQESM